MKKLVVASFVIVMVAFLTGQAIATKPGELWNPNGFPSGEHFNLNIIGKNDSFTCPVQKYYSRVTTCVIAHNFVHQDTLVKTCPGDGDSCVLTTIPIYGKVIFVPESGEGIEIYMQSGKKGGNPKNRTLPTDTLQVIDPCAVFDGDGAVLQLPPNEGGYDVYARALATPTGEPSMIVTPALFAAEDEEGQALYFLGRVTDSGFAKVNKEFTRQKGKSVAVPITDLFTWSGIVFYLDEEEGYSACEVCAVDEEPDGTIDWYYEPTEGVCIDGGTKITVYCREYSAAWIFSIADFVEYLWDVNNKGLKLLQVRFYPVGAETEEAPSRLNTLTTKWGEIKAK